MLEEFTVFLGMSYSQAIATWCSVYWHSIQVQQMQVMQALKTKPTENDYDILLLSLGVTINDIHKFIKIAQYFITDANVAASRIIDAITDHPTQTNITYDELLKLTDILQDGANEAAIDSFGNDLTDMPLIEWSAAIE